jgi:ATP-dependent Lon protease
MFGRSDDPKKRPPSSGGVRGTRAVPLLPLRDIVVFPHMVVPLFVGREKSVTALERAMAEDKLLLLAAQQRAKTNDPTAEEIFPVGCVAQIIQLIRLPDGTVKVLVEGKRRAKITRWVSIDDCFAVEVAPIAEEEPAVTSDEERTELEALLRNVHGAFETYVKLNKRIPPEMLISVQTIDQPSRLADTIAAALQLKLADKQALIEEHRAMKRLERLYELMQGEIEVLQVEKKIRSRVKKQMEKTQKEYYLNEQMQAIQKELGERDEFKNELSELEEKIKQKGMSAEAKGRLGKELKKLKMMSPMSAEATVVRNYIDWVLALPWDDKTQDKLDVGEAQGILDEDHFGLTKVKERVLEYLSVQALVKKLRGPILCLVGPPGVGKTSLAKSIARATGRKFVRLSLGGVRDEAEIRGHRRTYIGALPGKLIQSLRKAGSNNPVFLLDEIDKMSTDFRGDPASALLEVLDPEQNHSFNDHYLDLDYDLSDVMFIATANSLHSIPGPLIDRMEIIELPSYTEWEKVAIAEKYLVPKEKAANGVSDVDIDVSEPALRTIIHHYTREAGVRNLEREIGTIFRKIAKEVVARKAESGKPSFRVTPQSVPKYLDVHKIPTPRNDEKDEIGYVNGLAWSPVGGSVLAVEIAVVPGTGKVTLTGNLGTTFQESAHAAMSYVRSRSTALGLDRDFYSKIDLHVHVPPGFGSSGTDGPSAGVTIATALASALARIPARRDVAMTGEVTLRGRVRPIGGLKEKVLAAHRLGIRTILIPRDNRKDLRELPKKVLKVMNVIAVDHMDEVLRAALVLDRPTEFLAEGSRAIDWRAPRPEPAEAGESTVSEQAVVTPTTH